MTVDINKLNISIWVQSLSSQSKTSIMIVLRKSVRKQKTYFTMGIIRSAARRNLAKEKVLDERFAQEETEKQEWKKEIEQKLENEKQLFQQGFQKKTLYFKASAPKSV